MPPFGWIQGPNTQGAGDGGWRPSTAVYRLRTSAGFGPAKNFMLIEFTSGAVAGAISSGGAFVTSTLQDPPWSRRK